MATSSASQGLIISISVKTVLMVLIVFVGGLVSGMVLFQSLNQTGSNPSARETLDLVNGAVWVENTWTEAGIVIVNTGQTDVTFQRIAVDELEFNWNRIYYWKSEAGPLSTALNQTNTGLSGTSGSVLIDGSMRTLQEANNRLSVKPQETIVMYIKDPINLTDVYAPTAIVSVFTQNNLYYKEIQVFDLTFSFMGTEQLTVQKIRWNWGVSGSRTFQVTVNNTGTKDATIQNIMVNYVGVTAGSISPSCPYILKASGTQAQRTVTFTVTYDYNNGTNYDISVVTSDNYKFTNTFQGGTNAG
jgi:hypothetical protein